MINVNVNFIDRMEKGEYPLVYILMETDMGWRAFGGINLSSLDVTSEEVRADGKYFADGTVFAGKDWLTLLSFDARVINFGSIRRTLNPKSGDLLIGYSTKEKAEVDILLDNSDDYFNELIRIEQVLGKRLQIRLGYKDDPFDYHVPIFNGLINNLQFNRDETVVLTAIESLLDLSDYYYLERAGRFDNPLNTNDKLPIVYGDCSDGANWKAPCIDSVNNVYCYAKHSVLSVANGNDIRVYVQGYEINPSEYTFNHADPNYEYKATITFASSFSNLGTIDVVVGGKGKEKSGILIENIIDIIDDLLFNEIGWTGTIEPTEKAKSHQLFNGKNYIAAGVITNDFDIWNKLIEMVSSFFGAIFINSNNELVISLDLRKWNDLGYFEANAVITKSMTEVIGSEQNLEGIVNHLPASYAYDYYNKEFKSHTDDSDYIDTISKQLFGDRSPGPFQFYWIRDLATVNSQQDILVNRLSFPIWKFKVKDISSLNIFVELGDTVQYSVKKFYSIEGQELINQHFLVIGIEIDLDSFVINWVLIDTRSYRTIPILADGKYFADGTVFAGDNRDQTIY